MNVEVKKASIEDLAAIRLVLRETMLPLKETGILYHINKNLLKIDRAFKTKVKELEELNKQFIVKDDKGNEIKYKTKMVGNQLILETDAAGHFIPVEGEYKGSSDVRVDIDSPEYKEAQKAWTEDAFFDDFHQIEAEKIKALMESGKLDGVDITPLIGFIISEEDFLA